MTGFSRVYHFGVSENAGHFTCPEPPKGKRDISSCFLRSDCRFWPPNCRNRVPEVENDENIDNFVTFLVRGLKSRPDLRFHEIGVDFIEIGCPDVEICCPDRPLERPRSFPAFSCTLRYSWGGSFPRNRCFSTISGSLAPKVRSDLAF